MGPEGIEPSTSPLWAEHSTIELWTRKKRERVVTDYLLMKNDNIINV